MLTKYFSADIKKISCVFKVQNMKRSLRKQCFQNSYYLGDYFVSGENLEAHFALTLGKGTYIVSGHLTQILLVQIQPHMLGKTK